MRTEDLPRDSGTRPRRYYFPVAISCVILGNIFTSASGAADDKYEIVVDMIAELEAHGTVVSDADHKPIPDVLISRDELDIKMGVVGLSDEEGKFNVRFASDFFTEDEREDTDPFEVSLHFAKKGFVTKSVNFSVLPGQKKDLGQITLEEDPAPYVSTCQVSVTPEPARFPAMNAIDFFPNGEAMITGAWFAGRWDLDSEKLVAILSCEETSIRSVAVSPDARYVAIGYDEGDLKVWDFDTGQVTIEEYAHFWGVEVVDVSSDGSRILSGGSDGKLRISSAHTGAVLQTIDLGIPGNHRFSIIDCQFHPDDERIIVAGDYGFYWIINLQRVKDAPDSFERQEKLPADISQARFSPDGRYFLIATRGSDSSVMLSDINAASPEHTFKAPEQVSAAVFVNNDLDIVFGTDSGKLYLWKRGEKNVQQLHAGNGKDVRALASLPGTGKVAAAVSDGTAIVLTLSPEGGILSEQGFAIPTKSNTE